MTKVLRTLLGEAIPPTEIIARLKQVDERLDLKLFRVPMLDGPNVNAIEQWAIVVNWLGDDPRHAMVERGDLGNNRWDILGMIPLDCSVQDAFSYFEKKAIQHRDKRDIAKMAERAAYYNLDVTKKIKEEYADAAEENVKHNGATLLEKEGKTITKLFTS